MLCSKRRPTPVGRRAVLAVEHIQENTPRIGSRSPRQFVTPALVRWLIQIGAENIRPRVRTAIGSTALIRSQNGFGETLPFRGRRNVTHGASAVTSGAGVSARQFYALCEA